MGSKGINSPYVVAFIAGLVMGFGLTLIEPLEEWMGPLGEYGLFLFLPVMIGTFMVIELILKQFFGFRGFVLKGDNGSGRPIFSYLIFFMGLFMSFAAMILINMLLGAPVSS